MNPTLKPEWRFRVSISGYTQKRDIRVCIIMVIGRRLSKNVHTRARAAKLDYYLDRAAATKTKFVIISFYASTGKIR